MALMVEMVFEAPPPFVVLERAGVSRRGLLEEVDVFRGVILFQLEGRGGARPQHVHLTMEVVGEYQLVREAKTVRFEGVARPEVDLGCLRIVVIGDAGFHLREERSGF